MPSVSVRVWMCMCEYVCVHMCMNHDLHHVARLWTFSPTVNKMAQAEKQVPSCNKGGGGGSAESAHCHIVVAENSDDGRDSPRWIGACRAVFNERKIKPGSYICMDGLESIHKTHWPMEKAKPRAICGRQTLCDHRLPTLASYTVSIHNMFARAQRESACCWTMVESGVLTVEFFFHSVSAPFLTFQHFPGWGGVRWQPRT